MELGTHSRFSTHARASTTIHQQSVILKQYHTFVFEVRLVGVCTIACVAAAVCTRQAAARCQAVSLVAPLQEYLHSAELRMPPIARKQACADVACTYSLQSGQGCCVQFVLWARYPPLGDAAHSFAIVRVGGLYRIDASIYA